jgi:chitinase
MNLYKKFIIICSLGICLFLTQSIKSTAAPFRVVGYYCGPTQFIDSIAVEKLTHLIFCFGGLQGNTFHIHNAIDTASIKAMVALKSRNPSLQVMLSLGGWGGCETCSAVFGTATGRSEFVRSVKQISSYFKTDGIDLDWEYPAIKGFPGHAYTLKDRDNFTALLKELRQGMGNSFTISFAAGGFTNYIDSSIQWREVIKYCNFINIMSYDLVHGYSKISGHHTPLYSTTQQTESTDHAVKLLLKAGVPKQQLVIGAAFYGRYFEMEEGNAVDLYQPCHFLHGFSSKNAKDSLSVAHGFIQKWDNIAQAPYAINTQRRLLATYDNEQSIALKTSYAIKQQLGGIMFWQLIDDKPQHGLLDVIDKTRRSKK